VFIAAVVITICWMLGYVMRLTRHGERAINQVLAEAPSESAPPVVKLVPGRGTLVFGALMLGLVVLMTGNPAYLGLVVLGLVAGWLTPSLTVSVR
jgi:hypothetical protein